jgi:type VI secretion system protein ImpB
VAPPERIRITYKPDGEGVGDEQEIPFRLLVTGDFTQRGDDTPLEERKPVNISKDNFDRVMADHDLRLQVRVPDRLSGDEGASIGVALEFKGLSDFSPGGVAQQVPELQTLLELRRALVALKSQVVTQPAFRRKLQEILKDPSASRRLLEELGLGEQGDRP